MTTEAHRRYYVNQEAFVRDFRLWKSGEITRTFSKEWTQALRKELSDLTGRAVTIDEKFEDTKPSGTSWCRDLFPTVSYKPRSVGFYNFRTCLYLCVGDQREFRIHYNVASKSRPSEAIIFIVPAEGDGEAILTQHIARTYPMNYSTTAPPLSKIPNVTQTIVKHMLQRGLVRNGVSLARSMQFIGTLDNTTKDTLREYESSLLSETEAVRAREDLEKKLYIFANVQELDRKRHLLLTGQISPNVN